jgi:choline kinase
MDAVIIAAGRSSRLASTTQNTPKTLLPFGHDTILSTILANLNSVGIERFVIVVGYQKDHIVRYLRETEGWGLDIELVENKHWHRGNGISVLSAEGHIRSSEFVLSMSDHIVSFGALSRITRDERYANLLLVDPRIDSIRDLDDATKVEVKGTTIVNIGKDLEAYNAIDCGIFRLDKTFFASMREKLKEGQDSISAGVRGLIAKRAIEAVFVGADDSWVDIDTTEAYDWAQRTCTDLLRGFGEGHVWRRPQEDRAR